MGHYDNCRPENCSVCGQAQGHCEHTKLRSNGKGRDYIKKGDSPMGIGGAGSATTPKSMFRGTKRTQLSKENFGAGSFVGEGNDPKKWLVVAQGSSVVLMRMKDFELIGLLVPVEDPNFLSKEETRNLINVLPGTFTDYDFDTRGLK
jgi:hypothetical protein